MSVSAADVRARNLGVQFFWIALGVAVVAVVVLPLFYMVDAMFREETRFGLGDGYSLKALINVYTGPVYLRALGLALFLATCVTIACIVVGLLLSFLIARTNVPAKSTCELLIVMPLFLSPFNGLIAWIALGSENTGFVNSIIRASVSPIGLDVGPVINIMTFAGAIWVMFLFFAPYVYVFTVSNLRNMDSSLEEAARTCGASTLRIMLRVTLPLCLPAVLASGILVFILAAETYTIPGVIGASAGFSVLPWKIYEDTMNPPVRAAHAAAAASMLLIATFALVWWQHRITRQSERFVTITGKGRRTTELDLGPWKWIAVAFIVLYITVSTLLPLGALTLSSFMRYTSQTVTPDVLTLGQFRQFFSGAETKNALWNTFIVGIGASAVCVLFGFIISYGAVRTALKVPNLLAMLCIIPVAVPGIVYGIGLHWVYLSTPIYGTIFVLLLAFIAKFIPYGVLMSRAAIVQVHPDLEQSARVSGARPSLVLLRITAPLISATLLSAFFFIVLLSMKELSASLLLFTARSQILSVLTWQHLDAGNVQFASAVGVIQTVLMIALVLAARLFGVKLEGSTRNQ